MQAGLLVPVKNGYFEPIACPVRANPTPFKYEWRTVNYHEVISTEPMLTHTPYIAKLLERRDIECVAYNYLNETSEGSPGEVTSGGTKVSIEMPCELVLTVSDILSSVYDW